MLRVVDLACHSWHRLQPRRIIPGQKVHASILYANAYKPRASLGEGFDIPIVHTDLDTELDDRIWETGLFDDTAAQELVAYLGGQQGVAPIYLDRLLFMLRFSNVSFLFQSASIITPSHSLDEGKQCVRNVPNWQNQFMSLISNRDCAPLVRLVTIVAYFEACGCPTHDYAEGLNNALLQLAILRRTRRAPRRLTLNFRKTYLTMQRKVSVLF